MDNNKKEQPKVLERKAYIKPTLKFYGDVRDLTLAPSPGDVIESGRGFNRRTGNP